MTQVHDEIRDIVVTIFINSVQCCEERFRWKHKIDVDSQKRGINGTICSQRLEFCVRASHDVPNQPRKNAKRSTQSIILSINAKQQQETTCLAAEYDKDIQPAIV